MYSRNNRSDKLTISTTVEILKEGIFIPWQVKDHCLLRAFWVSLAAQFGAGGETIKDTSGTLRSCSSAFGPLSYPAGSTTGGLVAGTDNTANTNDGLQYALNAKVNHGTGSGQLSYAAGVAETSVFTGGNTWSIRSTRVLTGNTVGSVTIKEVGLYTQIGTYYFAITRDVISDLTIPINTAQTLRVKLSGSYA